MSGVREAGFGSPAASGNITHMQLLEGIRKQVWVMNARHQEATIRSTLAGLISRGPENDASSKDSARQQRCRPGCFLCVSGEIRQSCTDAVQLINRGGDNILIHRRGIVSADQTVGGQCPFGKPA